MTGMSATTAGQPPVSGEADPDAPSGVEASTEWPAVVPAQEPAEEPLSGPAQALVVAHTEARQRAEAGDLTGARTLLEDALAVGEVRLGHDHPRLAPLMVDLATLARGLGNLTEALGQLRRAYAIVAATGGPEHPTSLSIEGRLAAVMYRLGEPTEAYDWHLADVGTRVLGPEHPAVKGAQQRLTASEQAAAEQAAIGWLPAPEPEPLLPSVLPTQSWDPDEPGLAPMFAPVAPGVYQPVAPAPPQYRFEPPPPPDVWHERAPITPRRRGHGGGIALVGGLGAVVLVAAAVVAVQLFGPTGDTQTAGPPPASATTEASGPTGGDTASPTPSPSPSQPRPRPT